LNYSASEPVTIAVIGSGFSGSMVAAHLLRSPASAPVQVLLIERGERFSRGAAYSTPEPLHLLNVPAGKMSAFPAEPEHFLHWAQARHPEITAASFVSRPLYGDYLEDILTQAAQSPPPGVTFKRIQGEAVALSLDETRTQANVVLEGGLNFQADRVVLALGNAMPQDPAIENPAFYDSPRYVGNPWDPKALHNLAPDAAVLMIGTGLTMVDKALELHASGHRGPVIALSRHGLVPAPHLPGLAPISPPFSFAEPLTARGMFREMRRAIASLEAGRNWRQVIDALRPQTQTLWQTLSVSEKQRFMRHLRPYWDIHRHRTAPQADATIQAMRDSGQLSVRKGRIITFEADGDDVVVKILPRGSRERESFRVSRVINCTGPKSAYGRISDPLVQHLLSQGLIQPDSLGLGLLSDPYGAMIDTARNVSDVLFTLGPPLKGLLWETTAVPEIRLQAEQLAQRLLKTALPTH
jgi:uncharacterized NAD(P)/FAD-binding protein YdhS